MQIVPSSHFAFVENVCSIPLHTHSHFLNLPRDKFRSINPAIAFFHRVFMFIKCKWYSPQQNSGKWESRLLHNKWSTAIHPFDLCIASVMSRALFYTIQSGIDCQTSESRQQANTEHTHIFVLSIQRDTFNRFLLITCTASPSHNCK